MAVTSVAWKETRSQTSHDPAKWNLALTCEGFLSNETICGRKWWRNVDDDGDDDNFNHIPCRHSSASSWFLSKSSVHLAATMWAIGKLHGKPCVANARSRLKKQCSGNDVERKSTVYRTLHESVYQCQMVHSHTHTQKFLPAASLLSTQTCFCTHRMPVHAHMLLHSTSCFCTQVPLHTHTHTHSHSLTHSLTHRRLYTQMPLHGRAAWLGSGYHWRSADSVLLALTALLSPLRLWLSCGTIWPTSKTVVRCQSCLQHNGTPRRLKLKVYCAKSIKLKTSMLSEFPLKLEANQENMKKQDSFYNF